MQNPIITKAVAWFFNRLNERGVHYAVLRKIEIIPENIGNDIDVLIDKDELLMVSKIVGECAKEFGFKTHERKNTSGFYPILYSFADGELIFIRLDFTNHVKNPLELLRKRIKSDNDIFYIPYGTHFKKPKNRFKNLITYPKRFFFPPGKFIVVLGPDGVGKSTTAKLITQLLEVFHIPVSHSHLGFRPKILPTKNSLMSLGANKESVPGEESGVPGIFRFFYHALDHFLGFWFIVRPALVRGRFFIGERYFYSYLVDPRPKKRYGIPEYVFKLAFLFMPKPDVVILLSADPVEIHRRRQEHSIEEIGRQIEAYRKEGRRVKSFIEIAADKPPHLVAEEAVRKIL